MRKSFNEFMGEVNEATREIPLEEKTKDALSEPKGCGKKTYLGRDEEGVNVYYDCGTIRLCPECQKKESNNTEINLGEEKDE